MKKSWPVKKEELNIPLELSTPQGKKIIEFHNSFVV